MLTKKQLKVIDVFRKNLGKKLTAEQIKQESGINSNNFLYKALSNCMAESIVTTQQVGKSLLYQLEINSKSASYLGLLASELHNLPQKTLREIEEKVSKRVPSFIGVVFGSYAKGKQKKDSDLDINIIVQDKEMVNEATIAIKKVKLYSLIPIHTNIFTADEFVEMLKIDEENVGKEIVRNHLVFYNATSFYMLIKPWIRL